jgi:hypothetical protein
MAVQFVTIANGQTVSSAFTLQRADRSLLVGCSSHGAVGITLAFQGTAGGPIPTASGRCDRHGGREHHGREVAAVPLGPGVGRTHSGVERDDGDVQLHIDRDAEAVNPLAIGPYVALPWQN